MAAGSLGGVISGSAVDRALGWTPGRSAPHCAGWSPPGCCSPPRQRIRLRDPALRQVAAERLPVPCVPSSSAGPPR
ncbi:hypothetical protein NKG94_10440 [Micromonospora sp. M12]